MLDPGQSHPGRMNDERVQLLFRRPCVRAGLGDVRNISLDGAGTVDDEVTRARHGHELGDAAQNDVAIRTVAERPGVLVQCEALATPETDRALRRAREHEPHASMA